MAIVRKKRKKSFKLVEFLNRKYLRINLHSSEKSLRE